MKQVREQVEKASLIDHRIRQRSFVNFSKQPAVVLHRHGGGSPRSPGDLVPDAPLHGAWPCALAKALFKYGVHDKFDLAAAHELRLDHSLVVPLHFLNPSMELPVVPIYTNGFASPLPLATRCFSLGRMVRRFIDAWDGKERVALIASGCFAMDVGGPLRGWTDREWEETISGLLVQGKYQALARRATEERINRAGNNSGELLNWITSPAPWERPGPCFGKRRRLRLRRVELSRDR
jgi:hypothetical protein